MQTVELRVEDSHKLTELISFCFQKSAPRPISRSNHSSALTAHSVPHHSMDPNLNFPRRSLNQVPSLGQQFRHGSRSTSRANRNANFMRRSLSQSDRPQNYLMNLNHGFVMPHQSYGNDAILNRNLAVTGMW